MRRLLPPYLFALLILVMGILNVAVPLVGLAWPVRISGIVPLLGGLLLNLRHAQLFEKVGTNIRTFNDPETLVRSAAFGWTRNPMYLGFALVLLGIALLLGSVVSFIGPIVFVAVADRWYIAFEERRLSAVFGADYDAYRAEVRRWFGRNHDTVAAGEVAR